MSHASRFFSFLGSRTSAGGSCSCRRATRTFFGFALASLLFVAFDPGSASAQTSPTIGAPPRLNLFSSSPSSPSSPDSSAMDTIVFLCGPAEICIPIHGEDDDGDTITLSLIMSSSFSELSSSDSVMDTTFCFTPDTAGVYCFVFELDDDDIGIGVIESDDDVDSVCVTVIFNSAPTVLCPSDLILECGAPTDPSSVGFATATDPDSASPAPTVTFSDSITPGLCAQEFTISRTWIATDSCGAADTCVQTISVKDTTPPVVTCPADAVIECNTGTSTGSATATDNCDASPTITSADVVTLGACPGDSTITRTWTATDACGNSSSCVQTISIKDTTLPVIICPADAVIECNTGTSTGSATATDNCDASPTITSADVVTLGACPGDSTITRTWTATDACGNSSSCVQTITIHDTTSPSITCPADVTVNWRDDSSPTATGSATATDICDPAPIVTWVDSTDPGACAGASTIFRTWTATDCSGNSVSCMQKVTVLDLSPPIITCPTSATVECGASSDPAATGSATAVDSCDANPTVTFTDVVTGAACTGDSLITRTWTATDCSGNSASCVQSISVLDTTAPTITCPANATVECGAARGPTVTGSATATDICDASPVITFSDALSAGLCPGDTTITRTWTATDCNGNSSSCAQIITTHDTTAPSITCPADVTINWGDDSSPTGAGSATATDICDPAPTVTWVDSTDPGACAGASTIFRTWTATDCSGNSVSCMQKVTVVDLAPPIITCPASATVECGASSDPAATGSATAVDSCDANPTVTFTDVVTGAACTGDSLITRTWTATDCSGNSASCVQSINVNDTTPPVITCPAAAVIECNSGAATGSATATDVCDPNLIITFADVSAPGACPSDTIIIRTWTATDCNGNSSSCAQTITIQDTTPPIIVCPAAATVECGNSSDITATGSATATDSCDAAPALSFTDAVSGNACTGDSLITRTWTATDCSGNSSSCDQLINITDTTPPQITCPPAISIECGASSDPAAAGSASATDVCDANPAITFTDAVSGNSCTGDSLITRTWKATDCSGNSTTCDQLITLTDTTPPVVTCPADAVIECNSGAATGSATATDICDSSPAITFSDAFSAGQCLGDTIITRTWVATDCSGNSSSCVQTISVQDTTPPIIVCPAAVTIECGNPSDILVTGSATATDSCDANPTVTFSDVISGAACTGDSLITRTWTATDCSGNSSTCDQLVSIADTTPPMIAGAGDTTFECSAVGSANPATATDICDSNPSVTFVADTTAGSCAQEYTITRTWTATDCSGNSSAPLVQTIAVQDTQAPVCSLPSNQSFTMCQPVAITLPVSAQDNCDGSVTCSVISGPGAVSGGNWSWIPPARDTIVTVTIRCVDACGNSCEGSFTITVGVNESPVLAVAADVLMENCDTSQVCVGPFSATDGDNNLKSAIFVLGTDTTNFGGQFCFTPDTSGTYRIIAIAEDSCGATVTDTTIVIITCNVKTCIALTQTDRADDGSKLPGDQHTIQGAHEKVYIVHESGRSRIGGFDFLIAYDNSALAFTGAEEGNVFPDREWEFFTYRFGPNGNCNGGCPSGKLRVLGIANQSGDGHVPLTYTPQAGDTLACLDFLVSNDRTLECQFVPIRFCWLDCGDNVLSDKTGDTLSISCEVFDYQGTGSLGPEGNRAQITNVNAVMPTFYGAPAATCEVSGGPGKPAPERKVNYKNGGIKIACADSIDARGDINLNGLSNEIADAVLYTKYFIKGLTAFTLAPQGQIAASDVNADGLPLTVADLVYLIRVIVGDALAVPKLSHNSLSVEFDYVGGVFSTSHDLGAALFVFDGQAEIDLLQPQLELSVGYREGRTYALIAPSLEGRSIGEYIQVGQLIATNAPLLSIEASDYDGAMVEALSRVVVPSDFALNQNYPNPFNPSTKFSFDLPLQTAYTLSVYNVSGQLVAEFRGVGVGSVEVEWNAASVASGMYFYKLSAGKFTSTRKALLLK